MNVNEVIAANAKLIREQRRLTLDAAAELTGVSRSMLAQIEKGDVNPTISVLWKLANGYKISFTSLMERGDDEVSILRAADAPRLAEDEGRYLNYPAFSFDEEKLFETYRIVMQPGAHLCAQPHLRGAEEYITVFSGEVEISAAGQLHHLASGDSIRFRADAAHAYRNLYDGESTMSMLIYYGRER